VRLQAGGIDRERRVDRFARIDVIRGIDRLLGEEDVGIDR